MATTYNHYDQKTVTESERTIAQKVCIWLGVFSLFMGVLGFIAPGVMGLHLSLSNNVLHLLVGAFSLWAGLAANPMSAYRFSIWVGAIYALVGIAGFVLGEIGLPAVGNLEEDRFLWRLMPGSLEFGTMDHIAHLAIGVIFLGTAFAWKRAQVQRPSTLHSYQDSSDFSYGTNSGLSVDKSALDRSHMTDFDQRKNEDKIARL